MVDDYAEPNAINGGLVALARTIAVDCMLADFAAEQGDAEAAWRLRQLANETEQRLMQLAAQLAD